MSGRLRRLTSREVLRILHDFGFFVAGIRGSHAKLRRVLPDGTAQILVVPIHHHLPAGTLRAIYGQARRYLPESELRPRFFTG